jgi:hypothetical protein
MLKEKNIYKLLAVVIVLCSFILLDSCAVNNVTGSSKPKIIQLGPEDCPWDRTYKIKNYPERKEYGPGYAKKEDNSMKDAL